MRATRESNENGSLFFDSARMGRATLYWRDYRYFPYERDFARQEVSSLFGEIPAECEGGLSISTAAFCPEKALRLTYFALVECGTQTVIPLQARLEASQRGRARQSTRYSAHGIHEYRGKFNPQIVRAIGNIIGIRDDAWILDPFCGSGTTLLEAAHCGWNARGVDRNPLAVRIANAKIAGITSIEDLRHAAQCLHVELSESVEALCEPTNVPDSALNSILGSSWRSELKSAAYLESWFVRPVLAQLVRVQRAIRTLPSHLQDLFLVLLSDQLRNASLQDPADLRIRRRKDPASNYPLIRWFLAGVHDHVGRICSAGEILPAGTADQKALRGDIRQVRSSDLGVGGHFDAVITSPPYETALPYIDTQRLSLVALGDIEAEAIQSTEKALIGARELTTRERRTLEDEIRKGDPYLPDEVNDLCSDLLRAASGEGNGFRRRNRPALTYRYFKGMAEAFGNVSQHLRPGGTAALLVGPNRTVLGGVEFVIDTPLLLARVAELAGFDGSEVRPLDAYARFDLHQQNSITSEALVLATNASRLPSWREAVREPCRL
jgi:hypothetical protein